MNNFAKEFVARARGGLIIAGPNPNRGDRAPAPGLRSILVVARGSSVSIVA
jgi:hypothetical protein